jgi:DoxX-like family
MNQQVKRSAISGLQWTLGLVVLLESVHFTLSASAGREFAKTGFPRWMRPALGGSEVVAAVLFLVPAASFVGGYALLLVFAIAVVIHLLLGEFAGVGSLLVYTAAVIVCMVQRGKGTVEMSIE